MPDFAEYEIKLKAGEDPVVTVDGKELPGVDGIRIYQDSRLEFPTVALEVRADRIKLTGEGNVAVSLGQSIIEFLEEQDPKELEAAVIGAGLGRSVTAAILDLLKERASGTPG